jgi:hypothetical protein
MKKCGRCKEEKPFSEFYKHKSRSDGLTWDCKECRKEYNKRYRHSPEYMREWRKNNPLKSYLYNIKAKHGITKKEYDKLFEESNGLCSVCRKPEQLQWKDGSIKRLALDHNHKTGKIRGLLCNGCNRALGYIHDDPDIARQLAKYLEK